MLLIFRFTASKDLAQNGRGVRRATQRASEFLGCLAARSRALCALLLIPLLLPSPALPQGGAALQIRPFNESVDSNSMRVEVTDAQGQAVPDATVTFRLPEDGSGGTFSTGTRIAVVNTNQNGQATVNGIRWSTAGAASVRVTASKGTAHAGILMERQTAIHREPEVLTKEPAALPKMAVTSAPKPVTVKPVQIPNNQEPAILPKESSDRTKSAAPTTSKSAVAIVRPPATQPGAPEPKPAVAVAIAVKPADQKPAVSAVAPQTAAAATPTTLTPMPTIEPPHVSITSVSGKQLDRAQLSQNSNPAPNVVITGAGQRSHGSNKKWVILAVVAAGAAGGAAVMLSRGKSSSAASTTSSTGVSIGAPTISIGAP